MFILVRCKHITEQKLCCTFNNCSLCDRLNLRKKLSMLSGCLCILYEISCRTRIFPRTGIWQQTSVKFQMCSKRSSCLNIVEFEFELFVTSVPWVWQWQWQCDSRVKIQKMPYSKYGLWNRWPQWGGYSHFALRGVSCKLTIHGSISVSHALPCRRDLISTISCSNCFMLTLYCLIAHLIVISRRQRMRYIGTGI